MPELNLTGDYRQDAHIVLVTMFYPDDEERRNQLLAQIRVDEAMEETVSASDAKLVLKATPFDDEMFVKDKSRVIGGWYAGKILEYIAIMDASGVDRPSKKKALFLLEKYLFGTRTVDGKAVKYSNATAEKFWYRFQGVAHLWAAWNNFVEKDSSLNGWSPYLDGTKQINELFRCFSIELLSEFLALAEWFRQFGEKHYSSNQIYGSTLRSGETWRVPSGYSLPNLRVSLEIPAWMPPVLEKYAPRS